MGAFIQWILFSFMGLAQGLPETVRFTPWEDVSSPSESLIQLQKSVHFIETANGTCTATTISSQGHMLSARHCLQICLIKSKIFQTKTLEGLVTYFEMSPENLKTAECTIQIDKVDTVIQIEATSPGLIFAFDEPGFKTVAPEKYKQFEAEGYTGQGDFVIFKVKNPTADTPCVSLSNNSDTENETLTTLGYPSETTRPDGNNSDGNGLYFSQGRSLKSITENSCVQEANFSESITNRIIKTFDGPTSFMTTLDAIHGSSGTAVMDSLNQVTGVLTNVFRLAEFTKLESDEPANRFCEGSGKALRIETILKSLKKQGYNVDQIKCQPLATKAPALFAVGTSPLILKNF